MKSKKVLLMYITEVSGHHQATLAVEKSLRMLDPNVDVINLNGFGYTYPIMEKVVNRAYMGVIKRTPKIWDYLYDNQKIVERVRPLKERIHRANYSKINRLFEEIKPDVVACTQAFPCGMVADFKKTHKLKIKVLGILTDYAPHSYWLYDGVDYYIVPSDEIKELFMKKGISSARIKSYGIPVDHKFTLPVDQKALRSKFGFDANKPVILIMGGGHGIGPIDDIVKSLNKMKTDVHVVVVAGTNKRLLKKVTKKQKKYKKDVRIYEYIENIDELMSVASFIITKPGGITTAEALVKGLPLVIVQPIPGQEMYNTRFLLKQGVALRVDNVRDIVYEMDAFLKDEKRLLAMKKTVLEHSKPNAAMDIAKLILE